MGRRALTPLTVPFEVRDYECDLQGIVNNAVYLHYLEHARHQFLAQRGLRFSELTRQGIHLVVVRTEIDYKAPLRSGERFVVEVTLERMSPVRIVFHQTIYRQEARHRTLSVMAQVVCAAMNAEGRPMIPTILEPLFTVGGRAPRREAGGTHDDVHA